ncbi:MAG: hypothetical protein F9K32_03230 [Desulfobulbaceae bacterium]|nr:MAG: hypothetical protein F9K32_03230 [Desulfobulbaceae bacterium]
MIENVLPGFSEHSAYQPGLQRQSGERVLAIAAPRTGKEINVSDTTTLSPEGVAAHQSRAGTGKNAPTASPGQTQLNLTEEEVKQLQQLKNRDREVRSHEQAHLSVAGSYARGGASYTYQKGPDGNRYATGGEVPIDVSEEPSAEATIQKMRVIRRAALAPAEPSPADRQIAANALAKEGAAKQELAAEQQSEMNRILESAADHPETRETAGEASPAAGMAGGVSRSMMASAYQRISSLAT